ncbi:hypothetical protein FDH82_gp22 [Roseobacter phage RDJL Phi 2]|uniref:Uncharacterized protein n=1 Tax=Roseobacter phage RDJL Phi 2 TaxID=1682380 RepID=A0A0K0PVG0_9CAUD|nr:hypothetical protein FDH82_gp22 [Roseobacter phage RDJL Phi 2]AKQ75812.1 hypothetical protein RDJLphi2_gp22 [Roseobacter phage RDJL Phi 2]
MSTNATISIALDTGKFANVYNHYDGQPERMLKVLACYTDEQILAAKEIRFMDENEIEAFADPRMPLVSDRPEKVSGYHYVRNANGEWEVR